MNSLQIFILITLVLSITCYKNTTKFWQSTLNISKISYQSYSGYQEIDWYYEKGTSGMFYNLFGAFDHDVMSQSQTTPLIIWLQGGPGSGSQFGAFSEIGPIRIQKGVIKSLSLPWNILGHLLFIDSPLNVGFSYQGQRHSKEQVSSTSQATDHLINFLSNFYDQFPSLKKSPLYITGQSFGGHYVPNLAKKILTNETFLNNTGVKIVGISIGNGWTDPINQINFFDSYLWSVGLGPIKFRDLCTLQQTHAIVNIYQGNYENATKYLQQIRSTPQNYLGNVSLYDFRRYEPFDGSFIKFLNANKAQFDAKVDYIQDHLQVYMAFSSDIPKSYASDVAAALKSIKVLIYNGQNDILINTAGVLQYLNGLNWSGAPQWKKTNKQIWTLYGQVQGWAKVSGNLWFVLANGAGHFVPMDKPQAAFSILGHFIHNDRDWKQ